MMTSSKPNISNMTQDEFDALYEQGSALQKRVEVLQSANNHLKHTIASMEAKELAFSTDDDAYQLYLSEVIVLFLVSLSFRLGCFC
jgi:hypothetical protein